MIKFLVVIYFFTLWALAQSTEPANLNLIQLKFQIVFSNRDMFLKPCVISESYCHFNSTETRVGLDIINNSKTYSGLEFLASSQNPNLFLRDLKGVYQVVGTTNQKGAAINVNTDRLLEPLVRLVGVDKVIEYVIGSLFFQMTNSWDQSLQTSKKVSAFWVSKFKSDIPLKFNEESIEVLIFKNKEIRVMLLDNIQAHVLTFEILKKLPCSNSFVPSVVTDYVNDQWIDFQNRTDISKGKFALELTYQCIDSSGKNEKWNSLISLYFQFEKSILGKKAFVPNSFLVEVLKSQKIN